MAASGTRAWLDIDIGDASAYQTALDKYKRAEAFVAAVGPQVGIRSVQPAPSARTQGEALRKLAGTRCVVLSTRSMAGQAAQANWMKSSKGSY